MTERAKEKIIIGMVGLGKWGRNLLKNFNSLPECLIKYGCDNDPALLEKYSKEYPKVSFTTDFDSLLNDETIKAMVIATPAPLHYQIARRCLESGKHVFVEKPVTLNVPEAEELDEIAAKKGLRLMVGHLMLYHPAIAALKLVIDSGELGEIRCIYTRRLNLGTIRNTENAMWSLAPHDISIILHLFTGRLKSVAALGSASVQKGIEDMVFIDLRFDGGGIGHIHVSWLDPTKIRQTIVVGSRKMAVFDEIANSLIIADKGFDRDQDANLKMRSGEDRAVDLSKDEPLKLECRHFIDCVRTGREPISNGKNGLAVLKVLSAAESSLKNGGENELF